MFDADSLRKNHRLNKLQDEMLANFDTSDTACVNDNVEQQDKESDIIEENLEEKANTSGSIDLEDITTQLSINNSESKIILKKPNEVYYEIYKIAKDKAKQHKKAAISHYLEAKKIKNTYLLDDLDNSDESSEEEDSDSEKVKNEINEIVEELL